MVVYIEFYLCSLMLFYDISCRYFSACMLFIKVHAVVLKCKYKNSMFLHVLCSIFHDSSMSLMIILKDKFDTF